METIHDIQEEPESTIGHRPSELQGHGSEHEAQETEHRQSADIPGTLKSGDVARKEHEDRTERTIQDAVFAAVGGGSTPRTQLPPGSFSRIREDVPPSLSTPGPKGTSGR